MNAEVTAENRPACNLGQSTCIQTTFKTHEYQRRIKIVVVSLVEFLVILPAHLAMISIKLRADLSVSRADTILTGRSFNVVHWGREAGLTHPPVCRSPPLPLQVPSQDRRCSRVLVKKDVTDIFYFHTPTCRSQGCQNHWYSDASWI